MLDECQFQALHTGYTACATTCLAYPVQGPVGSEHRCVFHTVGGVSTCKCPFRAILKPDNFTSEFPEFLRSGIRGSVSNALLSMKPDGKHIATSR